MLTYTKYSFLGLQLIQFASKDIRSYPFVQARELQTNYVGHVWPMSKTDEIYTNKVEIPIQSESIVLHEISYVHKMP